MSRWTLTFWNDWRYLTRSVFDLTVLRVNTDYLRGHYASVDVVVLGFGLSVTRYADPTKTKWEPIEHDGWGGPEQGMEHAP